MNSRTDTELLVDYAERRSEAAFAELVRRHVDLVYSAALRMVGNGHLASDVTQGAFVALARSAPQLAGRAVLSGWLHRTAQNIAAQAVRTEVRRRAREQEAAAMNDLLTPESDAAWEHIAPHLDAGLGELSEADRDALMLRYFERKSAREMARTLGISDEAAQKRVNRAVERLREFFAKRGVTAGASGLALILSAHAVQAAPAGLVGAISTTAALAATTFATATATATTTAAATKTLAMTTLQKAIVATLVVAAAAVVGVSEIQQTTRSRVQTVPAPPMAAAVDGMITTASGLKYQVLKRGSGAVSPKTTDKVRVHYHGTLLDGTVFDSSMDRGRPMTFPVDSVIAGWTEGIQLMKVGDLFKFEIPPNLGYGDERSKSSKIPPNSTLVFEVELLEIEE